MIEGLRSGEVRLDPWTHEWSLEFSRLRDDMVMAGIPWDRIEHVGSTAVVGLSAKPILDVSIGFDGGYTLEQVVDGLRKLRYVYHGYREDAGGEILSYNVGDVVTRHVHVVPINEEQWHRYLIHREYLRVSAEARV